MFTSDRQRSAACAALLTALRLDHLWTRHGPTDETLDLIEANGGYLSTGERVLLLAAADLWGCSGRLAFADVFRLDPERLRMIGELLVAVAGGGRAIDQWIAGRGGR